MLILVFASFVLDTAHLLFSFQFFIPIFFFFHYDFLVEDTVHFLLLIYIRASLVAQLVKNLPTMWEAWV